MLSTMATRSYLLKFPPTRCFIKLLLCMSRPAYSMVAVISILPKGDLPIHIPRLLACIILHSDRELQPCCRCNLPWLSYGPRLGMLHVIKIA